jgi:serine/threonine protein kinase
MSDAPSSGSLPAGTRLAHYEIAGLIGAGGMGQVYRARDLKLQRDVAVKLLPDDMAADEERRQRFEREARAVAALNHPGIVTIHSVDDVDGRVFLTMELVHGKPLTEL